MINLVNHMIHMYVGLESVAMMAFAEMTQGHAWIIQVRKGKK